MRALFRSSNGTGGPRAKSQGVYIKLPPLNMLPCVFLRHHDDQLADLAVLHPSVQCGHDFADVCFHLVVAGHEHVEAIFLDHGEVFGWVDAALVEDRVDGVLELRERGWGLAEHLMRRAQQTGGREQAYKFGH